MTYQDNGYVSRVGYGQQFRAAAAAPAGFGGHATLNDDLVAFWKFTEATGQNRLDEIGGLAMIPSGNDAAYTSSNTIGGDGCEISNGADLHIAYTAALGIGEAGNGATWNFWMYTSGGGDPGGYVSWGNGSGNNAMSIYNQSGGSTWKCLTSLDEVAQNGTSTPSYQTVEMWTLVFRPEDFKPYSYYDAGSLGSGSAGTVATLKSMTGETLYIGKFPFGVRNVTISEFGLWDRALTTDEIDDLYNTGSGLLY